MILGIDSSAITAGCAVLDEKSGKIVAESFLNTRHTHSETLLPMAENVLKSAEMTIKDVDVIAVTNGPGSFTGLRIGVSCVKGLAFAENIPVVGVSALEVIAYNFTGVDGVICACMDARLSQVYNALFRSENGVITRLCEDRAIKLDELSEEINAIPGGEKIFIAGDGAELFCGKYDKKREITLAPQTLRFQRGSGVCFAAAGKQPVSAAELMPSYLRLPQAERERMQKEKQT